MQPRGVPSQDAPIPVNKYCNRVFKLDSISILLPAAIGKLTSHPGPGVEEEEEEEEEEEGGRGAVGT